MRTAGEGGEPFSQSVFPSLPRYLLLLLPNQPGGNKRLKQYDARGGGKVDAADFAFDGDADMMRREPITSGGNPEVSRPKTRESFSRELETVQGGAPPGAGEDEPPARPGVPDVGVEVGPYRHIHMGPIVEARRLR